MKNTVYIYLAAFLIYSCDNASKVEIKTTDTQVSPQGDFVIAPIAQKISHPTQFHGEILQDDYFWMRHRPDTEGLTFPQPIVDYIAAENNYTNSHFSKIDQMKELLQKEMEGRLAGKLPPVAPPTSKNRYGLIKKSVVGQPLKQYYMKDAQTGTEKLILDLNVEAHGATEVNAEQAMLSLDGKLLAYSIDRDNNFLFELYLLSTETGLSVQVGNDRVSGFEGITLSSDSKALYFVTSNSANRPNQLFRYDISNKTTTMVYEETNDLFFLDIRPSSDLNAMIMNSKGWDRSETRILSFNQVNASPVLVAPNSKGHIYEVDVANGVAYIKTSSGAETFKLVTAPADAPEQKNWKDLVSAETQRTIEQFRVFKNHIVRIDREGSKPLVRILDLSTLKEKTIDFTEDSYLVDFEDNVWDSESVRLRYESFLTPRQFMSIDLAKGTKTILAEASVNQNQLDLSKYEQKLVMAQSDKDGFPIPIWLIYKKGTKLNDVNPMFIWSYSNYGGVYPSQYWGAFLPEIFSIIDRGVVYAQIHCRGGSQMGRQAYLQGKLMNKKNTFEDFVSAHNFLIKNKYTSSEKTVVQSASAGGLLIGYLINNYPHLAKAFIANVPFVDLINTEADETLPLTVQEWEEWGSPYIQEQFDYMRSYSPYDNVKSQSMPAVLATTSQRDTSVFYWEPLKWVAKMRAHNTGKDQIYLRVYADGNHTDGTDDISRLKRPALNYAFALDQLGIINK